MPRTKQTASEKPSARSPEVLRGASALAARVEAPNTSPDAGVLALPLTGLSRWDQLEPLLPVKRVTWERLGVAGRAPKPIRISTRTVCWDNAQCHLWFADPEGYRALA